jgi:hypothetical protein
MDWLGLPWWAWLLVVWLVGGVVAALAVCQVAGRPDPEKGEPGRTIGASCPGRGRPRCPKCAGRPRDGYCDRR